MRLNLCYLDLSTRFTLNCTPMRKPVLLAYATACILLGWWPWNVLLLWFGPYCAGKLWGTEPWSLGGTEDRRRLGRHSTQPVRNTLVFRGNLQPPLQLTRIVGSE